MPFANKNDYLTGRKPVPTTDCACDVASVRFTLDLATGDLALNDCGAVGILPAGHVPVDVHVDATDLDSGAAAMVLQVGICNAGETDLSTAAADGGANWGSTTAANTAFHQRLNINGLALVNVAKAETDRKVGVKVATAPTTPVAGTVGVTLFYRAA